MLFWGLVVVAALLASEAFLRLPIMAKIVGVSANAQKAMKVVRSSRISDHWKERILPAYALRIGLGSVTFFLLLCAALIPIVIAGLIYPGGFWAWSEELLRPLVRLQKGLEVMDLPAACRTYNVLMGEGRKVAVGLLLV